MRRAVRLLCAALIALSAVSIYVGGFRPLVKSRRYVRVLDESRNVKGITQFKEAFDGVFGYWAPISDIEIVKFFGGDVIATIFNGDQKEETALELARYLEKHSDKNETLQLIGLATAYQALWRKYGTEEGLEKSVEYFEKARSRAPNLPQPLYNLFDTYRASGKNKEARAMGENILELWDDPKVKEIMETL